MLFWPYNTIDVTVHKLRIHFTFDCEPVNMSYPCEVCGRPFSTPGNRSRHKKQMHSTSTDERRLTVIGNRSSVMQHPFTCIVAGCTQSGKTVLVKSLLENAQTTISPAPQRIIWCYGQWQPSYFDIYLYIYLFI
jgi:hypothetical protein